MHIDEGALPGPMIVAKMTPDAKQWQDHQRKTKTKSPRKDEHDDDVTAGENAAVPRGVNDQHVPETL